GEGTGSGRGGDGMGGAAATKAVKISGDISRASDYPIPDGGREVRIGTSVSIAITVGADGLPKSCRVFKPGPFPETNARTCELAMARFRFKPATNRNGEPVQSVFGWKQDFFN
ncbi:MAG: energy transducer TonB, partial [Pontixanthobacter sp.]